VLGLTFKDGTVGLRPELMAYLDARSPAGATEQGPSSSAPPGRHS
jgi:hypothetical protein